MAEAGARVTEPRLEDVSAVCACLHTRKAARAVTQQYDEVLRPAGIRATQFSLLVPTAVLGPVRLTVLANVVGMDRTMLTRNLARLQREGLVRVETGADLRTREVGLTPKGRTVLDHAIPLWREAQAQMATALGPDRLRRLIRDLEATVAAVKQE